MMRLLLLVAVRAAAAAGGGVDADALSYDADGVQVWRGVVPGSELEALRVAYEAWAQGRGSAKETKGRVSTARRSSAD